MIAVKRRFFLWFGNSLIVAGLALLLAVGGLWGYSQYAEAQAAQQAAQLTTTIAEAWTPVPSVTPTSGAHSSRTARAVLSPSTATIIPNRSTGTAVRFVPWPHRFPATPTPVATPTPRPIYPALSLVAPSIHLDAKVVEAPIVNGEWVVPKFAAGHLQGTAQPLQGGNIVLAGHVQSISSGDVFANIAWLRRGSQIRLYTKAGTVTYTVKTVEAVKNSDVAVIAPSPYEKLTLITCTGTWLPLQHDYNERTVVIADRDT